MLFIAISWSYILVTSAVIGLYACTIFRSGNRGLAETTFAGLFLISVMACVWAFFFRINYEFHIVLIAASLIILRLKFREIRALFIDFYKRLIHFSAPLKILLAVNFMVILAQSASSPFVLDNETYYIQTIKWLDAYGIVPGLANLHIFLAHCSGWHICQSVYGFSFLYGRFNDISGFCLLMGNIYAFLRLDAYLGGKGKPLLISALLPLANIFFLRFSGAPSSDIPIYIFTFVIADNFLLYLENRNRKDFHYLSLLIIFSVFIKATSGILLLLPLYICISERFFPIRTICIYISVFALFVLKNIVISGYPLFPLPYLRMDHLISTVPQAIVDYFLVHTHLCGYKLPQHEYDRVTVIGLLKYWIMLPGLHGAFNKLSIAMILFTPMLLWKRKECTGFWILYLAMSLQIIAMLFASPQYRYFLNLMLFFLMYCLAYIPIPSRGILTVFYFCAAASLVPLAFSIQLHGLTANSLISQTQKFNLEELVEPARNSNMATDYEKVRVGNLDFYSPVSSSFYWSTGNGQIPCVNKEQISFIGYYFGAVPQKTGPGLKTGFYSKTVKKF